MVEKIVQKEWGRELWIVNNSFYCGKILELSKGFRCSMHYHKDKTETFHLLDGLVFMELDNQKYFMGDEIGEGIDFENTLHIEPGVKHRFTGLKDSRILEFSTHHEDADSYRDEVSGKVDLNKLMPEMGYEFRGGIWR